MLMIIIIRTKHAKRSFYHMRLQYVDIIINIVGIYTLNMLC